jgi:lysophosphatidic acid acyltransferase/lysophosphatidylinositol acyltransferase
LSNILFGRKTVAEVFIRRFDILTIPKEPELSAKWLMDIYATKDALIDSYALSGSFTKELKPNQSISELPITVPNRRIYSLLNTLGLNLLVVPCVLGQIGAWAFSGSMWQFGLALVIVISMYVALKKFIGLTKISKASSYGNKKKD